MQCSVLTILGFSKAYDTVWREKSLLHMLVTIICSKLIGWIQSIFNNHRARVQLINVFSSSRRFTQGLPHGSVLSPLLFLSYINNLASSLNDNAVIALFSGDVSILTRACRKKDCLNCCQVSS